MFSAHVSHIGPTMSEAVGSARDQGNGDVGKALTTSPKGKGPLYAASQVLSGGLRNGDKWLKLKGSSRLYAIIHSIGIDKEVSLSFVIN